MIYTLSTTIEGEVDCTAAQIIASVLDAPNDGLSPATTPYTSAQLIEYAEAALYWTFTFGFRTAGQVGRANHETNHLRYTGDVPFGSHNFAGLGATGGVTGRGYDTISDGWLAVCAHQAAYTWGAVENWPQHLRKYVNASGRHAAVMTNEGAGKVKTWGDFTNGRWAWSAGVPIGSLDNGYARACVAKANRVLAQAAGETAPELVTRAEMLRRLDEKYPLEIIIDHIPAGNSNRPGTPAITEGRRWITTHETGNTRAGADAEMHRDFTHGEDGYGGGGTPKYEGVSFTWVVDDKRAIQLLPREEKSWQASDGADGPGNSSESIETCVNVDGNWERTKENLSRLHARLIVEDPDNSPERLAQHNTWARDGKNCPQRLRANNGAEWNAVVARTRALLVDVGYFGERGPGDKQSEIVRSPDGRPILLYGGIYREWVRTGREGGYGLPTVAEEYEPKYNARVAWFERGRAEWRPGQWPERHDVTWGLVANELRIALNEIDVLRDRLLDAEAQIPS
jgi:hypothetical protein